MRRRSPKLLVTGGAGFIGVTAAAHFAALGWGVRVVDDLSRPGSRRNLAWARAELGERLEFVAADVRDRSAMVRAAAGVDAVLHLAAQVAVTASLADPLGDFDINVRGTLNVLEAVRSTAPQAAFLYASTNKVYGPLRGRTTPVGEDQPLDFVSPYACSKGAADQYVRDYAQSFDLRTVVLRQSCIYGAHQHGSEEQGWVAHFVCSILAGRPLVIHGDGRQVRDLLDARDLCRLYSTAVERVDACSGQVFNIGGGESNARELLSVVHTIEQLAGVPARYVLGAQRLGDQRYYVSDVSHAQSLLGWRPEIDLEQGLRDLMTWARKAALSS